MTLSKGTGTIVILMLILAVILFITWTMPLMMEVYGQAATTTTEKVAEVQDQVQGQAAQIDTTTAVAAAGGIGTIATFLAQYIKGRKLEKSDKRTDKDTGLSFLYMYRLIQTMDALMPDVSKCLDQPFNADPMQKHITIRMKLAEDANSTAQYLMTTLNTAPPSMTPSAAVIVADAKGKDAPATPPQVITSKTDETTQK